MPVSVEFGPLIGPWSVEAAAKATVTKWLSATYLQELERQNGLLPGTIAAPSQIYGAADLTAWEQAVMPAVIVVCEDPEGEPEYFQSAGYFQAYLLTVGVVLQAIGGSVADEDVARQQAGLYATALMGVMDEQFASDNPTLVQHVKRSGSPSVSLPDPEARLIYLGQVTYDVTVQTNVAIEGPAAPIPDQGAVPTWPTVASENLTVTPEHLS